MRKLICSLYYNQQKIWKTNFRIQISVWSVIFFTWMQDKTIFLQFQNPIIIKISCFFRSRTIHVKYFESATTGVCKKNLFSMVAKFKTAQNSYNYMAPGKTKILINFTVYCDVQIILSNDTNDIGNSTFRSKTMALLIIYMF